MFSKEFMKYWSMADTKSAGKNLHGATPGTSNAMFYLILKTGAKAPKKA